MSPRIPGLLALATVGALLSAVVPGPSAAAPAYNTYTAHTTPQGYHVSRPTKITALSAPDFHPDALYSDFHSHHAWYGYINGPGRKGYYFKEGSGAQVSAPKPIPGLAPSTGASAPDNCGVWPVGRFYEKSPTKWIGFFHEEQRAPGDKTCITAGHHTRWTIRRMVSTDQGMHWRKDKIVITQDTALTGSGTNWKFATDDAGSPRLVIRGAYMYLFYRAANRQSATTSQPQQASVARATLRSLGVRGAWKKYYNGGWRQRGIGGRQSAVAKMPDKGRGISWNSVLRRYIDVVAAKDGIYLYGSAGDNFLKWSPITKLVSYPANAGWHASCPGKDVPWAAGYAAIRGAGGGPTSGRRFWVYDMEKPAGKCIGVAAQERRRLITIPG